MGDCKSKVNEGGENSTEGIIDLGFVRQRETEDFTKITQRMYEEFIRRTIAGR